jgi:hypothetical protein
MSNPSPVSHRRHSALPAGVAVFMFSMCANSPAASAPAIPWLNQFAVVDAVQAPAAAAASHPCAGAELQIVAGASGAYHGQATQEVRLTNIGAEACHMAGLPNLQLLPANEAPQAVGASEAAAQLATSRIDLAPGDEAVLLLGTPGVCEAANKPDRKVSKRLQLALPGGGLKLLDGVHVDTLCGRATVVHFQPVHNEAAVRAKPARNASALAGLTGTLDAPDEATAGGTLHYVVTLWNPTGKPIPLAACPAYTQSLYADDKAVDTTLRLNCGPAGAQIAANASVSFDMQAQVPAALAGGTLKLSWKLQDGPGVGKLITLR